MATERIITLIGACVVALVGIAWKDFASIAIVALTFTVIMESTSHQRTLDSLERLGFLMAEFLSDNREDDEDEKDNGKHRTAR